MPFQRKNGVLCADTVALNDIAAQYGTPCYVYLWDDIEARYRKLEQSLQPCDAHIRYAVKANSNLAILRRMSELGAGFDIVSGGELERVIRAGGEPSCVVFSGVGKTQQEISFALKAGIGCFNVESTAEVHRIAAVAAQQGTQAPIAIRVNPDISVETHPYIATGMRENKFGVAEHDALDLAKFIRRDSRNLQFLGLCCHIGSQINAIDPYRDALEAMLALRQSLLDEGIHCGSVGIGGGFGIRYQDEMPLSFETLGELLAAYNSREVRFEIEPGRSLVGPAGLLLTRVEYLKPASQAGYRNFCIVDAAMNDLCRPALYDAYHRVEAVENRACEELTWNLVGPICESGDFLALNRRLAVQENDLLALLDAGAYGFAMSSNYNSRPRPAEVIVHGGECELARRRESMADMLELEML
ncbi:MAG: diaminopimelate decarboxylase [Gammaproteobacteria bacterium]|nr:diaminopimelate decarboxylase [Gammaproteobacteria bacterium]